MEDLQDFDAKAFSEALFGVKFRRNIYCTKKLVLI